MADPLSVAGSIAGLLSLAGYVYTTLDTFITDVQNAPSFANRIRIEVDSFRNSLNALHTLLSHWTAPPKRAALIPADFIVLTFTDATLLFSEIEAEVLPLVQLDNFNFLARARWTLRKAQLETLVSRLQWQKITLVLQLNILKCASENDAHKDLVALTQNCMQKLADNQDLEQRLELVEAQLQQNTLGDSTTIRSDHSDKSGSTVRPMGKGIHDAYPIQHKFEETLYASWVYRRNQTRGESMSFRSSVIRQSAWSALSELSLAQISIVSVIALPVQRSELFNTQWYAFNEGQGEVAKDDRNNGKLVLGSKTQPPESSPRNKNAIFYEGHHGLSNTGDNGSANTVASTEVDQEMLEEEVSDSTIADIELLLQERTEVNQDMLEEEFSDCSDSTISDIEMPLHESTEVNQEMPKKKVSHSTVADIEMLLHESIKANQEILEEEVSDSTIAELETLLQGDAHKTDTERETRTISTLVKMNPGEAVLTLLGKALQKANIAVLRDKEHDYRGANRSYAEASNLSKQAAKVYSDLEDDNQLLLGAIRTTYSARITELMKILEGRQNEVTTQFGAEPTKTEIEDQIWLCGVRTQPVE